MIDAPARRAIRTAVDDFLDGRITSSTFDERLFDIETEDATAREVISLLWYTYDDIVEHGAEHWEKPTWDFVCAVSKLWPLPVSKLWPGPKRPALMGLLPVA